MIYNRIGCGLVLSLVASAALAAAPIANYNLNTNTVSVSSPSAATDATDAESNTAVSDNSTDDSSQASSPVVNTTPLSLDQRVSQVENQMQYLIAQQAQAKSLGSYITNLQGQIEQLNFQVQQMQKQLSFVGQNVVQLEARVKLDETKTKSNTQPMNAAQASKAEMTAFQAAYNLLVQHQYAQAIQAFNAFMTQYPKSGLAPDAHYWLGELYLVQGQPDQASQNFQLVIAKANSDKAPDAMLKLGMIYLAYGDSAHAKQMFQKIVKQYPNASSATAAQAQLKSMQ
ncbi:MAG: tol-pal system protein YbgF [Gammaproteobacteria bacterium]|nr:tol-pal system protein YbgF [Gammaproteobacteria bacterium]